MFREAEIAQAIGRLRAVRSTETKTVILATHTPCGLPVIHKPLAELVPAEGLARLLIAGGGVAPLVPALMVQMVPGFWLNANAAELDIRRNLKPSFPLYKSLYKETDGFKFRCEGQRRASGGLTWLVAADLQKRLEQITGKALVECDLMGATAAEPPPAQPEQPSPEKVEHQVEHQSDARLVQRSTLYARLMSPVGKLHDVMTFKPSPRNAHPPDWGELVRDPVPIPQPQPAYAGGYL
jgi:hypothetical protein